MAEGHVTRTVSVEKKLDGARASSGGSSSDTESKVTRPGSSRNVISQQLSPKGFSNAFRHP